MSGQILLQVVLNGLTVGMMYLLVVLGLDMILRTTKILNFAHGHFYMLGAYTCFLIYGLLDMNYVLALLGAALVMAILGVLSYLGIFNFVQKRFWAVRALSMRFLLSAMASLGLMMILQQGTLLVFGTRTHGLPSVFPQVITFGNFRFPLERVVVILLGVLLCFGLYWLLFRTKLGKAMRAVSDDAEAASLQGINVFVIYLSSFIIGCILAGLAGAIIAPVLVVSPGMGHNIIFLALLTQLVGGILSYKGYILGAIVVGLFISFGFQLVGGVSQVLLFIFVMAVLVIRPGGFLGEYLD